MRLNLPSPSRGPRVLPPKLASALAAGLLAAGCAGSPSQPESSPVTRIPQQGNWFCQMAPSGDGWDCVQDPALAENPQPSRLPEPKPPASEPRAPAPAEPPLPEPLPNAQSAGDEEPPADPAVAAPSAASAASPPPAQVPDDRQGPAWQRLAHQPERPTPLTDLPGSYYALQLMAMKSQRTLETFAAENGLTGTSAARVERDGELYYVLLLGIYETLTAARQAAAELPQALAGVSPWIRPLRSLQAAMKRADALAASAAS